MSDVLNKKNTFNVGVVGVGLVGEKIVELLIKRKFPINNLWIFGRTARTVTICNRSFSVQVVQKEVFASLDIVLFAGTEGEKGASRLYAQDAVQSGCVVIDNGSDFRMDPNVPLIIPEINSELIPHHAGIIANPNCSTIIMLMGIYSMYRMLGISKIVVSTYQAISGAGKQKIQDLMSDIRSEKFDLIGKEKYLSDLSLNVRADGWSIEENAHSNEENKMIAETRKILQDGNIEIYPTTVRVPVLNGHAESVYIEFKTSTSQQSIMEALMHTDGLVCHPNEHTMNPKYVSGKDQVYVSRLRFIGPKEAVKGMMLWVTGDNLLKGAALNAVQIAEKWIR